MTLFHDYLEGTFDNKRQALRHPTRYARIIIKHRRIDGDWFEGEQSYYNENPYRKFKIQILQNGEKFRIKNYHLDGFTYKEGCDTLFEKIGQKYYGANTDCTCWVIWKGIRTYLTNEIVLGYNMYNVMDSGIDPETGNKLWGSQWGYLEFDRVQTTK